MKKLIIGLLPPAIVLSILICAWGDQRSAVTGGSSDAETIRYAQTGRVHWYVSEGDALVHAPSDATPVFIYLHRGTSASGRVQGAFSNPLAVEAIETLFLPLAYEGEIPDDILVHLKEPAHHESAVIVTDQGGNPLATPVIDQLSLEAIAEAMVSALSAAGFQIPPYLNILNDESRAESRLETAVVTQHCYWSGEVELGPTGGVLATEPGVIGNAEALTLYFDPSTITYEGLLEQAKALGLLDKAFPLTEKQYHQAQRVLDNSSIQYLDEVELQPVGDEKNIKYYLGKTTYRYVPLTSRQAILVNSALFFDEDPSSYLSPRQMQIHDYIKRRKNRKWENLVSSPDFEKNWATTTARIREYSRDKTVID